MIGHSYPPTLNNVYIEFIVKLPRRNWLECASAWVSNAVPVYSLRTVTVCKQHRVASDCVPLAWILTSPRKWSQWRSEWSPTRQTVQRYSVPACHLRRANPLRPRGIWEICSDSVLSLPTYANRFMCSIYYGCLLSALLTVWIIASVKQGHDHERQ